MYMYIPNPSIRNCQFPIWAKVKVDLGLSKTAIFKKWELLIYFINNKDMNYYKIQSIRALFISIGDAQKATILRNERILEILINF